MAMTLILFLLRQRHMYLAIILTATLFLIFWGFRINPVGDGVVDQQCATVAPVGFQYSVSDFARGLQEFIPSVSPIAGFALVVSTDRFNYRAVSAMKSTPRKTQTVLRTSPSYSNW